MYRLLTIRFACWLALLVAVLPGTAESILLVAHGSFKLAAVRNQCIAFPNANIGGDPLRIRECRVTEFGTFGVMDGRAYYYTIYCLVPNGLTEKGKCGVDSFNARFDERGGLAIFVQDRSSKNEDSPEIVRNQHGTMLDVPIGVEGTGHENDSKYYLWSQTKWKRINTDTWISDLAERTSPRARGPEGCLARS